MANHSPDNPPLRGLYAITSEAMCADSARLIASCEAAMRAGAGLIQYRDKTNAAAVRLRLAMVLAGLCKACHVPLIINDDIDLALKVNAAGVHVGSEDTPVAEARAALGPHAIVGATCHASLEQAQVAVAAGASYVAFGSFFASNSKPEAAPAPLELLSQARQELAVPICAIGGITPANGAPLVTAGADLLAAIEGVFDQRDAAAIANATRDYVALFDT